jgi:hypothetical protein
MSDTRRLATLERQLLRYLNRSVSHATTPRGVHRAMTLRRNVVRQRMRALLALQEGKRSWYDRRLTPTEQDLCEWLAGEATPAEREVLLQRLMPDRE